MTVELPPNDFVSRVIRPPRDLAGPRTILLSGTARGGTSLLAGTVHDLGIPTGKDTGTFEDHTLGRVADAGDTERLRQLIRDRDATHPVWAWKRPALLFYLEDVLPLLREPSLILVFKDLPAVAQRKEQTSGVPFVDQLVKTANQYARMAQICHTAPCPLLVVSYEGARREPRRYVEDVAAFLGRSDPELVRTALGKLEENRESYLRIQGEIRVAQGLPLVAAPKEWKDPSRARRSWLQKRWRSIQKRLPGTRS